MLLPAELYVLASRPANTPLEYGFLILLAVVLLIVLPMCWGRWQEEGRHAPLWAKILGGLFVLLWIASRIRTAFFKDY